MSFQTILLAVALQNWERTSKSSLAARDLARAIALGSGKTLQVLCVYNIPDAGPLQGVPEEVSIRHREEVASRARWDTMTSLEAFVQPLESEGIAVEKILKNGNPRELIVKVAEDIGADLLVIGSHSRRSLIDVMLGGTARQVTSDAPCAVAVASAGP
jgi:nucleotide-binding universal stress UspA family protein